MTAATEVDHVTTRQRVLNCYGRGEGAGKIANRLGLSRSTVRDILAKEGRGKRTCGASRAAIEAGDGCGVCVCCRAVDEQFQRWRRGYQAKYELEA